MIDFGRKMMDFVGRTSSVGSACLPTVVPASVRCWRPGRCPILPPAARFCISNDEVCIRNDEFCIENDLPPAARHRCCGSGIQSTSQTNRIEAMAAART